MAYIALYRKYRPATFDKLIGQEHIVRTLTNQIKSGKVSHAYLFTGTRGTGKTSAARIFARAINCLHPVDGNPCNECAVCKELLKPNNMDVIEIDGASNNKVDEIRDLRDAVGFLPSIGKYKVYIIDEVHMLTDSAYNALLKTLEEPPAHVVFILCTTEVQKMPATILSRCLRFDFKLVGVDQLSKLISSILDDTGVQYTQEAVNAVAVAGEGSVRDALSVLDRCVAFADGKLEYNDVLQILGATDKNKIFDLAQSVFDGNVAEILRQVEEISKSGKSISVLAKDMAVHIRDMLICQKCDDPQKILHLPQDIFEKLNEQAKGQPQQKLLAALDAFNRAEADLRYALDPRVSFEVVCLKAATDDSADRLAQVEKRLAFLEKNGVVAPKSDDGVKKNVTSPVKDFKHGVAIWAQVLKDIRASGSMVLSAACAEIDGMYAEGQDFVLPVSATQNTLFGVKENFELLAHLVRQESGLNLKLAVKNERPRSAEDDIKDVTHLIGKEKLKIK